MGDAAQVELPSGTTRRMWATLLPPSMADDWTAIRDVLTHEARESGHKVSESAAIKTRLTVDRFEPDIRALLGEIEVD